MRSAPVPEREVMGRRRNDSKPLDVRERSAWLLREDEPAIAWRVSLFASDRRMQEQVIVLAPGIEVAERTASAFARHNGGHCASYLVERIDVCAEPGCDVEMLTHDPRRTRGAGAPSIEEVEDPGSWRRCARHME